MFLLLFQLTLNCLVFLRGFCSTAWALLLASKSLKFEFNGPTGLQNSLLGRIWRIYASVFQQLLLGVKQLLKGGGGEIVSNLPVQDSEGIPGKDDGPRCGTRPRKPNVRVDGPEWVAG
jgi:hypothetical protein